ncbi:uncharacterized protein CTRU02_204611 [Colletotrichum truncatum]|uniref:Uncharacterized protein n=1 Tax=Colletotrichum truncatum TaxID=5467 RepID=A0ACC3ZCI7_COLTU|nr:uncharacterized protein CTRU02_02841 [Colletotrichum truncatum]KAF6797799.1 hypothetical protein CTRU02_02841 [Colletotrichum truncatum]
MKFLLEAFWKPSPSGLSPISFFHAWTIILPTRPAFRQVCAFPPLKLLVRDDDGGTPFWPLLPSSDAQLPCASADLEMAEAKRVHCEDADPR